MKMCAGCKEPKPISAFPSTKRGRGLYGRCLDCRNQYNRDWWHKNKADGAQAKKSAAARARYERNVRFVVDYLRSHHCISCGEPDPIVLEFDHRDDVRKVANISDMVKNNSLESIKREIEKCDVMCANCHRRRTALQFNFFICEVLKG